VCLHSPDGETVTTNVSMNADLPLIDISVKLTNVQREISDYTAQTSETSNTVIAALDSAHLAYATLTSSHLDQLRRACQLAGNANDVIRLELFIVICTL